MGFSGWKQRDDDLIPEKDDRPIQKPFPVILVSTQADNLIRAVEMASCWTGGADEENMGEAYGSLNDARGHLYRYIESLERRARVKRTLVKRFE